MLNYKDIENLCFFCIMLSGGACMLYGTLLYINIKMLSYFEQKLDSIEKKIERIRYEKYEIKRL